jgi:hypothetical protein
MWRGSIAALIAAMWMLSGCGSSHAPTTKSAVVPPAAQPGLGATLKSFEAVHGSSSHEALAQETLYTFVTANKQGRVISYQVTYPSAMSDTQRINLLGGTALPSGAIVVQETPICKLWRSVTLRQLTGMEFARATTVPGTTSAQIRATTIPSC